MSQLAVRTERLGKLYRLEKPERYRALRDTLARAVQAPWTLLRPTNIAAFWALKDVNLEVKHGEVLGLIGRNGAGKTTLLKLLSRITQPTSGWAEIHGRVGSLLEVGTGFHPELSGRENIYLSGAILGMSRREIARKFDEIIAFAEVEDFLEMQVKHYSSGMYLRLAFAVAAHLEPDILLVDEVLAVGDIKFQKKCLGKMGEVRKTGRTVILVSHQLNQIRQLCDRVVWIDNGGVRRDGNANELLAAYESLMLGGEETNARRHAGPSGAKFLEWDIDNETQECSRHTLATTGQFRVTFILETQKSIRYGEYGIALYNAERQLVWGWAKRDLKLEAGVHALTHQFPTLPLRPGSYRWQVEIWDEHERLDSWDCQPEMVISTEHHQHYLDDWTGILNVPSQFGISSFDRTEVLEPRAAPKTVITE